MSDKPLIEIRGLSKVYPTPDGQVVALEDIHLSVNQGEIYGVIGMSGAGKSTLIRCINRLDSPNAGEIFYRGRDILKMDNKELLLVRRKVSMIFQQFNLLMQRNLGENVRYPLEIAGMPRKQADKRVRELLEIVGLGDRYGAYPAQLSGGQKQRVAIARALASEPDVLLCDEATSALDPMTTQSILSLLQDINRRLGITIILITHEMAVIRQICTRVAILDGGRLAEEGTVDEVFIHTRSEAGRRLFGILPQEPEEDPGKPTLRIVFDGASAEKPLISALTRDHGVMVNIFSANMKHLGGKAYGQMIIEKPENEDDLNILYQYFEAQGLSIKEVNNQ